MYAVGLDTAQKFLLIALMKDGSLVDSVQTDCPKQQSEMLLPVLDELLKKHSLEAMDIDEWVITRGPGSYTGIRIAMTLVKVLGSLAGRKVYTLSTLQLYAGLKDCYVIMDARASRVYAGRYRNGSPMMADTVYKNEQMAEIIESGETVCGDLHLFGREDVYDDLAQHFADLREQWQPVENIDLLTPVYLKSSAEYLK
ncbi:MAG: tRNA (adenosine(37)-N6)-threonylcarbamoyltransferase complex dimerization subunit type 1 TsaB [Erysipelotrichaceae bacterium]|nr:tRNA (adenosine(37)-N6)-threonylcarbamoyltransferase complex dimerization subunit type 1 TsaB [Erysipelotrichaceae bacterium]